MTRYTEQTIPGAQHSVRRYPMGAGRCAWCGQERKRRYDYRGPMALDYRLNRPTHGFYGRGCYASYHG